MHYNVVIVGAGPAGLACGARLASNNIKTLIIERKKVIGPKSCAGGITWSGLLRTTPETLIEREFRHQYIVSPLQNICVSAKNPIIATVARYELGQYMAEVAENNGATIATGTAAQIVDNNLLQCVNLTTRKSQTITFDMLIGADGSTSTVRRFLKLPSPRQGFGINYQLKGEYEKMEWHLNQHHFLNGYGWIFPHRKTLSVGAYVPQRKISAALLQNNLRGWAAKQGCNLSGCRCTAGYINYDYRGYRFDNIYLVGDAAGLASALTGEGIYPAIVSAEAVADEIIQASGTTEPLSRLIARHRRFVKLVNLTEKNGILSAVMAEIGLLLLRAKVVNFKHLEMAE